MDSRKELSELIKRKAEISVNWKLFKKKSWKTGQPLYIKIVLFISIYIDSKHSDFLDLQNLCNIVE